MKNKDMEKKSNTPKKYKKFAVSIDKNLNDILEENQHNKSGLINKLMTEYFKKK